MANDFDLPINPLSGSVLEVKANSAPSLDGTEQVLVVQGTTVKQTTTQDIADLGGAGYLVYTALLSQSGTDAPAATVLQNTLGGTVVWTRSSIGFYVGTLSNAFPSGRTYIAGMGTFSQDGTPCMVITSGGAITGYVAMATSSVDDEVLVYVWDAAFEAVDLSTIMPTDTLFLPKVEVYPA